MADAEDSRDEDSWLYGDSSNLPTLDIKKEPDANIKDEVPPPGEPLPPGEAPITNNESGPEGAEPGEVQDDEPSSNDPSAQGNGISQPSKGGGGGEDADEEEDEDEDSEDDVHVTIGDIRTAPQYPMNIKRGAQLSSGLEKHIKQTGKFSIEEFESIGTINGVGAHEFSIDALEEKPWRKPGADITDYFNYGFNEDTWRAYCERQKQMRIHESGVGLGGLGVSRGSALTVVNENSKYGSTGSAILVGGAQRKPGAPIIQRRPGVIDVISGRRSDPSPPKEIEVMTGDSRRDYNRKGFDMTVPPPGFDAPPPMSVVSNYPSHGGYGQDYSYPEMDPYYSSYDTAQEMQWSGQMIPPAQPVESQRKEPSEVRSGTPKPDSPEKVVPKERERERDRHKERHRHRSRSRSTDRERRRKHKSRSRSPSHRSHKKKKSKKSDRDKSKDRSD